MNLSEVHSHPERRTRITSVPRSVPRNGLIRACRVRRTRTEYSNGRRGEAPHARTPTPPEASPVRVVYFGIIVPQWPSAFYLLLSPRHFSIIFYF